MQQPPSVDPSGSEVFRLVRLVTGKRCACWAGGTEAKSQHAASGGRASPRLRSYRSTASAGAWPAETITHPSDLEKPPEERQTNIMFQL